MKSKCADPIAVVRNYLNANDARYGKDWLPAGWDFAPQSAAEARAFLYDQWRAFPELHDLALFAGSPDDNRRATEALHLLRLVYIDTVSRFENETRGCRAYVPSAIMLICMSGLHADYATGRKGGATIIPFGQIQRATAHA